MHRIASKKLLQPLSHTNLVRSRCFTTAEKITTRCEPDALHVKWGQVESKYSYLWLRDNCSCPKCLHPSSRQKLHSSADIPLEIKPTYVNIVGDKAEITWDQPLRHGQDTQHTSQYSLEFLRTYQSSKSAEKFRFNNITPQTWNRDEYQLNWVSYNDYMNTDQGLHKVIQRLYNKGLVFLNEVPTTDEAVTQVAERIGPIQETFYGRDFDVKNVAKSINIAYTSLYLGFHMDLMYLDSPPGVQLLHSLKNSVTGGASIFVDSFRAVELLKSQYPEDYKILKSTPVTFHYVNNGHHMYYKRPTIVDDEQHSGLAWSSHVNYAPQFQGPLDDLTPTESKKFYQAFQRFADFIEDDSLRYQLTLQPGELVMFANRRVLHGRTAFDPTSGDRHLKGTYLNLDSLKDKLRVLSAQYGYDSSI
ncbi:hypothetical protein G6F57_010942 [Rhizopus arrhizus]|uniref:Gamma-butyrobetaine dioxygenase n=1 Tax=Rhizopus oryzae TaxID=64495 RepID=A0A9P6X0J6_RHIOR|nr:hypothetical protein G6F30_010410 [Rhizopus arrhizus]KAG1411524.1 hypothetical protein G6F58_008510 [Rhizopus delemar]KAG0975847.1 hypothetical protein G6F29_011235 [Rhizopus arrhizus]KAG0983135.1 hypothetical protein G6F28_011023 [Rhizopus arrhizus]KAG1005593.1 hypothetical protein G6F27_009084 [Rhizopus arrhizus]